MTYKEEFIKFMADSGVLTFGDFTLKSGRKAPYFINAGNYKTGAQLAKLGEFTRTASTRTTSKPTYFSALHTRAYRFRYRQL